MDYREQLEQDIECEFGLDDKGKTYSNQIANNVV